MKIYSNRGNPFGLNLLLITKFAKCDVTMETMCDIKDFCAIDGFITLPLLELDNGVKLFSVNAAAKYLFPMLNRKSDEWLEWSLSELTPMLYSQTTANNCSVQTSFNSLLQKLEKCLSESVYLSGDIATAADVVVWSLLKIGNTLEPLNEFKHLAKWYQNVSKIPIIEEVIVEEFLNNYTFNALQNSNRYGNWSNIMNMLHTSNLKYQIIGPTLQNSLTETVTASEREDAFKHFIYTTHKESKEQRIVLPKPGERNLLITSALPYVNNIPHLGNIIGCVLSADIFARYSRSVGYNTLFICGTDEYGTATENKAITEKLTPREICDKYFEIHNSIYRWFGIGFDYFGRTTTQDQTEIVQDAYQEVYRNGYIISQKVEQQWCEICARFLADRFVEGTCPHHNCGYVDARGDQCDQCGKLINAIELISPRCKMCGNAPNVVLSEQLFFDLRKIEPQLKEWVKKVEGGWTYNARVITQSWLKEGLKPRCITRDLMWGIPVPQKGFEQKVFYVWFDAPFGYISMTKRYTKEYKQWWQPAANVNVELYQFMAKDNVPFHTVVWPSVLLAINGGHVLVSHIMATEYLTYENGKFSKSRGIGVFGNDAQDSDIPADVWRFYLASARPEGQDSTFSWNDLISRNNCELLNNLGNFINRALVFCEKNFNGIIPPMNLNNSDINLLSLINRELNGYIAAMEKAKLRDGIRHILSISRCGNGYIQSQQPWVLLKGNNQEKARAGTIIALCCNISALLANLMFPYMPTSARALFSQLNIKQTRLYSDKPFMEILLPKGHKIGTPFPLFAKLEQREIEKMKEKYSGPRDNTSTKAPHVLDAATITADELEKAVRIQGDKVRVLKSMHRDKSIWQAEVNTLLELKRKLTAVKGTCNMSSNEKKN